MDDSRGSKRKLILSKSDEDLPGIFSDTSSERPRKQMNRRLHGKLEKVMSMPVDIFCEIATHLSPYDLLRLARSSKALRELLMSKSSATIWKSAEESCGLPECPADLSSPQYAQLLFDPICSLCFGARAMKQYFFFRVRLCKNCQSSSIKYGWKLPSYEKIQQKTMEERRDIFSLVPTGTGLYRKRVRKTETIYYKVYPEFEDSNFLSIFYAPTFEAVFEQYTSLPSDSEKQKFVSERREVTRQINIHSKALISWLGRKQELTWKANVEIQIKRREEIYERLTSLGYSEDDLDSDDDEKDWKWRKMIEKPTELTERAWIKVRPCLEETIRLRWRKNQPATVKKRRNELAELVKDFLISQASDKNCFVTFEDVLQLPFAQQIINDVDPRVSFNGDNSLVLKTHMMALNREWPIGLEENCKKLLLDGALTFGTHVSQATPEMFACQLATSFFAVRLRPDSYDLHLRTFDELVTEIRTEYQETISGNKGSFQWDFKSRVYRAPRDLIHELYKSVNVGAMTQADMAAKGKNFVCLCCIFMPTPMTWVDLVRHFYKEILEFGRMQGDLYSSVLEVATTNSHAINKPHQLARYQGNITVPQVRINNETEIICWDLSF